VRPESPCLKKSRRLDTPIGHADWTRRLDTPKSTFEPQATGNSVDRQLQITVATLCCLIHKKMTPYQIAMALKGIHGAHHQLLATMNGGTVQHECWLPLVTSFYEFH
tara:strand:- start:26 stop:346 length:321 start_codon:yes stop_codon:yes gene_type:complete